MNQRYMFVQGELAMCAQSEAARVVQLFRDELVSIGAHVEHMTHDEVFIRVPPGQAVTDALATLFTGLHALLPAVTVSEPSDLMRAWK